MTKEAKKNGKSSVLSAIKKLCTHNFKEQQDKRPQLAYANYDEVLRFSGTMIDHLANL